MSQTTSLSVTSASAQHYLEDLQHQLQTAVRKNHTNELKPPPAEAAMSVGLRYASDMHPGIRRKKNGKVFSYADAKGRLVRDNKTLARIKALVIPPAWKDVWICPDARGHLQVTGRDARGRKQYRYHPLWRAARDLTKYHKMIPFAEALPRIRSAVEKDLRRPNLDRRKVLATVVRLLEETLIRVGNEEYAKDNHSYGLTTLQDKHARIDGSTVQFHFRGKSGVMHLLAITDPRLSKIIRHCRDLPGEEIFQYFDRNGERRDIKAEDVNAYLREIAGEEFTAKDFRTWAGTVHAALTLRDFPPCTSQTQAKKNLGNAIKEVAAKLGNTPAVCRKCYVHPAVMDCYLDSTLGTLLTKKTKNAQRTQGLSFGEAAVLALLKSCFEKA